jgi:hypothetical protein
MKAKAEFEGRCTSTDDRLRHGHREKVVQVGVKRAPSTHGSRPKPEALPCCGRLKGYGNEIYSKLVVHDFGPPVWMTIGASTGNEMRTTAG